MANGSSVVGIGLQYGDEGKIKAFDRVAASAKVWVRFNGGPNAGHNLKVGDVHLITHGVPSGFIRDGVLGYIGSGTVINPEKMNAEIAYIAAHRFNLNNRLFISANASLIQPSHILLDRISGDEVGTTGNGIGPAYADQALRQLGSLLKNIRVGDYLANPDANQMQVQMNLEDVMNRYADLMQKKKVSDINLSALVNTFDKQTRRLAPYLCDNPFFVEEYIQQGHDIFFEGANAVGLDVILGTVPYVTASRTIAAAAYTGGDLPVKYHTKTIGVAKAIASRVGNGPFIGEFGKEESEKYCMEKNELGESGKRYVKEVEAQLYEPSLLLKSDNPLEIGIALRMLGNEYGATTKRPRRIGMLDLVMLKQNCRLNGVDELYLNKVDCLRDFANSSLPGIPLVTGYELDGQKINYVPATETQLHRVKPIIDYFPAFREDISSVRQKEDLPKAVHEFIRFVEDQVQTPLLGIGVGPEREEYVALR
ncbi:TPA: adenylosuccinate synthetase [Candidatus Woesearchaeota archaeon]|nr:adenylosuccinate synthetase [Candidatus Woesearchaeota archaeon]HIG93050.1 adenylosuccinate synthetase [Candidatus Woesearchaeota archaeon]